MQRPAPEAPVIADQKKIRALPWCLAHAVLNSVFVLWTLGGSAFGGDDWERLSCSSV